MLSFYIYICHCNISPTYSSYHNTLEFFQHLTWYQHGTCRILADGTRIWHLEHCRCITSVLDRRPWPIHLRGNFWMSLQPFLLDFNKPHPTPVIWWNFGCFVLALNAAFIQQLLLEDEGYESGSNKDIPTPSCNTPHIHQVSSLEHASFNPAHSTPCRPITPARPVRGCLSFSSDSNQMDTSHSSSDTTPDSSDIEDEDF